MGAAAAEEATDANNRVRRSDSCEPEKPPEWWVRCRRCARTLATGAQLCFLRENERGAHLALRKDLLVDEQAHAELRGGGAGEALAADARHKSWRLHSHAHVAPPMRFFKTRTLQPAKRARTPFEVNCPGCQHKVATECQLDERPEIEYLLNSKNCECIVAGEGAAKNAPSERKWGLVLKKLKTLQLSVYVEVVELPGLAPAEGGESAQGGESRHDQDGSLHSSAGSKRYVAQSAAGATQMSAGDVVLPTAESIRESFARTCKLSSLREYQVELVLSALLENTIVYLPTGAGNRLELWNCWRTDL